MTPIEPDPAGESPLASHAALDGEPMTVERVFSPERTEKRTEGFLRRDRRRKYLSPAMRNSSESSFFSVPDTPRAARSCSSQPQARRAASTAFLRRTQPLLPLLALLLLSASSCDNSLQGEGGPPLPTGLKIVDAFPAFPTIENPGYVVFDAEWPVSLRLDLNQTAQPNDLVFTFAPIPLEGFSPRASLTAPLFWIDGFTPDSSTVLQTIVIDGPRFLHPWLWEFWVKEPVGPYGIITADVVQRHKDGPSPAYALLLFYEREVAENADSPSELFRLPAQRSSLAVTDITDIGSLPSDGTPRFERVADALVEGTEYAMGVILDTNGDGIYDAEQDWWGTAHTNLSGSWIPWYVSAQPPLLSHHLEAELLPPPVD